MDKPLRQIKTLSISTYRNETFEGRPHIVAPVTLLVEGVHAGSGGPLLYTAQELRNCAMFWNGMPLPVYHPERDGMPISCNSPEVTEARSVGRVFNVVYEETPTARLRGEVWIDVNKAQQISPDLLTRIYANQPVEVSTGLFSTDEAVQGVWNGENYIAIVHDIRPDHLALLPGTTGACSLADGCGIRSNQAQGGEEVDKNFAVNMAGKFNREAQRLLANEMSMSDTVSCVARCVYQMDGPTADNYVEGVFSDHVIYRVEPGPQSVPGTPTKMYKRGYTMDDNGRCTLDNDMVEVRRETNYVPVQGGGGMQMNEAGGETTSPVKTTTTRRNNVATEEEITHNEEEENMATPERVQKVNSLIQSGAFTEADRSFLENADCPQFTRIESLAAQKTNAAPAAAAPQTFEQVLASAPVNVQAQFRYNEQKFNEMREGLVARIKGNANNKLTDEQLGAMGIEVLEATANSLAPVQAAAQPTYIGAGGVQFQANAADAAGECLTLPTLNETK